MLGGLENQRLHTERSQGKRQHLGNCGHCRQGPTAAACPAATTGAGRWVSRLLGGPRNWVLLPPSLTTAPKNYPESRLLCVASSQFKVRYRFICVAKPTVCAHVLGKQAPGIFSLERGKRPCLSPRPLRRRIPQMRGTGYRCWTAKNKDKCSFNIFED